MNDPHANPHEEPAQTNLNNNQQNTPENTDENIQQDYNVYCAFCHVVLYGGMDENNLMHCQGCHRIWDGNAQCLCEFEH